MLTRYISVDVETSGPSPARHAVLAIGACAADEPERSFYVELQPGDAEADPGALAVSGLSLERLAAEGTPPAEAMEVFATWVDSVAGLARPVFVALNAPFDWMFTADYFHRYLGNNPFGHSALDLKALYMGVSGAPWHETSLHHMAKHYGLDIALPHHAREDAVLQAAVFRRVMEDHARQQDGARVE